MLSARHPPLPLAVVVHPRTVADLARHLAWTRHIPPRLAEAVLPLLPPFTMKSVTVSAGDCQTVVAFIACTATSAQIRSGRVSLASKLDACVRLAGEQGAQLITLSGYLGGLRGPVPAWTAGSDGKLLLGFWALRAAARLTGVPLAATRVAVLAATDPAGAVMARLLAREAREMVLVDQPGPKLDRLATEILDATGTAAILATSFHPAPAQFVIAGGRRATGYLAGAGDTAASCLARSVIFDPGRPPFLNGAANGAFVLHGGAARLPDSIRLPDALGFPHRTACGAITEGIMLALAGERPHRRDGLPTLAGCDRLAALAKRFDIQLGALMRDNSVIPWRDVRADLAVAAEGD